MTNITKRILDIKTTRGINDHQLEVGAELPPASTRAWRNGRKNIKGEIVEINPSAESIIKVARFLNVSADYLLCLTDEPKPLENREIKKVASSVPAIFEQMPNLLEEQRFVNTAKIYNELPDEYRERAFGLIMGIAVGLGINIENILRN